MVNSNSVVENKAGKYKMKNFHIFCFYQYDSFVFLALKSIDNYATINYEHCFDDLVRTQMLQSQIDAENNNENTFYHFNFIFGTYIYFGNNRANQIQRNRSMDHKAIHDKNKNRQIHTTK